MIVSIESGGQDRAPSEIVQSVVGVDSAALLHVDRCKEWLAMIEVFGEVRDVVVHNGRTFVPQVCGMPVDNVWQGWIEFTAVDNGETIRTPRETTQPNRTDLTYWATGLTAIYLDGAIDRALSQRVAVSG